MKETSIANRAAGMISNYLIVTAGAYGSLACFLSAFGMRADHLRLMVLTLVFVALCVLFYSQKKWKLRYIGLCAFIAGAIYALVFKDTMITEALCVFYRMLSVGARELARAAPEIPASLPANWQTADTTTFFVLLLFGISFFLGWAVVAQRSFSFSFLGSMLLLSTPLFLTLTPDWTPLLMVLAFWTAMLLISSAKNSFFSEFAHGGAILFALCLCLALFTLRVAPEEEFSRSDVVNDLRTQFDVFEINNRLKIFDGFGKSSGPGDIDFTDMGDRRFSDALMMTVTDKTKQGQYLRGNTGALYTGMGFDPIDSGEYAMLLSSLSVSPHNLFLTRGEGEKTVTITYDRADPRTIYTPYELLSTPSELSYATFEYDSSITKTRNPKEVTLRAADGKNGRKAGANAEDFESYADFVYEHYLQTPEGLAKALRAELGLVDAPYGESARARQNDGGVSGVLTAVYNYLEGNTQYTLTPGKTPRDSDFVEYFLFESGQGYCVHYATAAVMMYRACGIPARYAEGFVVKSTDYNSAATARVTDRQAHAWAEVFLSDIGWVPVEVTPGADVLNTLPDEQQTDLTPRPSSAPNSAATPTPRPVGAAAAAGEEENPLPTALLLSLLLALLIGLFFVARVLMKRYREKRFHISDNNAAVIEMYRYITKLSRYGAEIEKNIVALYNKAQFSQHTLLDDEVETVRSFMAAYRTKTFKSAKPGSKVMMVLRLL
ncbi:transglutaminase-like domain-containing protein [Christensenellaceae bacterium OttesenSCG-928-M15]|nr:transglutaminase-like domain-containing protein [Christensenellaceae bacterium OttesenSCG-928-M15]